MPEQKHTQKQTNTVAKIIDWNYVNYINGNQMVRVVFANGIRKTITANEFYTMQGELERA